MDKKAVIIITNSLTNDFMSPREKFQGVDVNVGRAEIHRLMGEDENFSTGPLPQYLHDAIRAKDERQKILHILLRDVHDPRDPLQQTELLRFGYHNIGGTEGAEFVPSILDILPRSTVIDTSTLSMPAYDFQKVVGEFIGKDILDLSAEGKSPISFIITGVYSNIKVLNIAFKIRNEYGFPNVFVSPHLVGSKFQEAHLTALQVDFPNALVSVIPGLGQIYEKTNIKRAALNLDLYDSCRIEPSEVAEKLEEEQRAIIENLFMFHTSVKIKTLSGGFSGGLLFVAQGQKNGAKTDPEILKIDRHENMQMEVQGYHSVKDFMGKNVPAFSRPVSYGNYTGVKMELAAMDGEPETFQSLFEKIEDEGELKAFLEKLTRFLTIIETKLYENTRLQKKVYPYRVFGLHTEKQKIWLRENIGHILGKVDWDLERIPLSEERSVINRLSEFDVITGHVDRLSTETAICHGDLNFANVITDAMGNIWTIDWSHAGEHPVELDFAKMENDVKFVMCKAFEEEDLSHLDTFESFLVSSMELPETGLLPETLSFVKNDVRFKKVYSTVQTIRQAYLSVKKERNHTFYWIALLKYATHTLSFDKRRGRGECTLPQLKYALLSLFNLVNNLIADDLHQQIKKDRRIPIPPQGPRAKGQGPVGNRLSGLCPPLLRRRRGPGQ